ncbi:MAG: type II toxin-antitoxin system VapC family toxin [Armatimonadota bacterium]
MPTVEAVCVDASLYLSILMPDEHSPEALARFEAWRTDDVDIIAPTVFVWECLNALRQSVRRERLTDSEALDLVGDLIALPIAIVPVEEAAGDVWSRFVVDLGLPSVYDATYLAVAHLEGCELWTEDRRLYNTVREHIPWVRCASLEA